MPVYSFGSKGPEVQRIQERLAKLGLYKGRIDADFGSGTERAVREFQRSKGITPSGMVDSDTWKALFDGNGIPEPAICKELLVYRCLALTGSFETGSPIPECFAGLSGDFDGQGISFGVLQWNFGQKSLQPLLVKMNNEHKEIVQDIFDRNYSTLQALLDADYDEQMEWARSIQHPVQHYVYEPWRSLFKTLARTKEFQDIQVEHACNLYSSAIDLCKQYELWSERAMALMFDIKVQNGSIRLVTKSLIEEDFSNQGLKGLKNPDGEVQKMVIVANRRAEAANPRWIEDVRRRKLTIANGTGAVHGVPYNLEQQYGIRLKQADVPV